MAVINNNDDLTSLLKTHNSDIHLQELFNNTYKKFRNVLESSTGSNHRILMLEDFGKEFKDKFNKNKFFSKSNNLDHIKLNYIDLITDDLNTFKISPDDSDDSDDMEQIINSIQGTIGSSSGISPTDYIKYNKLINNISNVERYLKYYIEYLTFKFKTPLPETKPVSNRTEQDKLLIELKDYEDNIGNLHVTLINKLNEVTDDGVDVISKTTHIKNLFSGNADKIYSEEILQFRNQIIKDVYYNYYVLRKNPEKELITKINAVKNADEADLKLKYIDCSFPLLHDKQEFRIKYKYYFKEDKNNIINPVSFTKDEKKIIVEYHKKKNDFFYGIYSNGDDNVNDEDDEGSNLFSELLSEDEDYTYETVDLTLSKDYLYSNYYDIGFGINGYYDSEGNYKYIVSKIRDHVLKGMKTPITEGMVITHIDGKPLSNRVEIKRLIDNKLSAIHNPKDKLTITFIKNVTINPIKKEYIVNIKNIKTDILKANSSTWLNKIYNYYISKIAQIIKYQIVNMIYITIEDLLKQIILPIDKQLNKIILSNILISNDINKESIYINLYYNLIDECLIFGLINQTKENLKEKISEDAIFKLIKFLDYYTCKHKFTTEKFIKNKNNEMLLYNSNNKKSFLDTCKARKNAKKLGQISPLRQNNCMAAIDILLNSKITWFDISAPICLDLESELDITSSTSKKKLNEALINTKYSNEINHFRLIINSKLQYFAHKFKNDTELLGKVKLTGLQVIYAINYFIKDRYLFLLLSIIDIKNPDRKPKEFLYKLNDVRADWHIGKSVYKWYYHEIESGDKSGNEINDLSPVLKVLDKEDEMIIAGWKKLHYFDGAQKVGSDDEKEDKIAEGSKHKGNVITHISQVIFEHSNDVSISGLSRDGIADELWKRININQICNLLQIELIIEKFHKDKINKLISYKSLISKLKGEIARNIEKIEQLKQECKEATEATEATEAKTAIEITVSDDDINITLYICCNSEGKLKTWIITNQKFDDINKEFLEKFNKEIDELKLSFDNSNELIESNTVTGIKEAIEEECTNAIEKAAEAIKAEATKKLADAEAAEAEAAEAEAAKEAKKLADNKAATAEEDKKAKEAKAAEEAKQRSITVTLNKINEKRIFESLNITQIFLTEDKPKATDIDVIDKDVFDNLYPKVTDIDVDVQKIVKNDTIIRIPLDRTELNKMTSTEGLAYYQDAQTKKYINLGEYKSNYEGLRKKDAEEKKAPAETAAGGDGTGGGEEGGGDGIDGGA